MLLLLLFLCASLSGSEKILAIFPFSAKSHFFIFEPIVTELANRGHEVTVISHFPKKEPVPRYTDISLSAGSVTNLSMPLLHMATMSTSVVTAVNAIYYIAMDLESVYKEEKVAQLLKSPGKFDMVITELAFSDMFLPIAHKYNAPLVMLSSSAIMPWGTDRVGLPNNPSYIPHFLNSRFTGPMTLYDRMLNTLELLYIKYGYKNIVEESDVVSKRYLGDVPHVEEMMKRTSLVLVNSHHTVNGARPLPPQVVEIGGIHIKPAKPLSKELETFITESEHGVVYFSLGSITNASTMPEEMRDAFCSVFAKLPQRVLWKWETDELPCKTSNVKTVKWMPQRDVLAHPNVRLFITHGGLLGTMEGLHCGVPMIGIPLFGDQRQNIVNLEQIGYAIRLELLNITEASVSYAVNTVLNDPKYRQNAHYSQIFRDRPTSALDTAIYWTEYVLRHKGAHHLRSAAVHLTWYQYLLLDVIAVLLCVTVLFVCAVIFAIKTVIRKVFANSKVKVH